MRLACNWRRHQGALTAAGAGQVPVRGTLQPQLAATPHAHCCCRLAHDGARRVLTAPPQSRPRSPTGTSFVRFQKNAAGQWEKVCAKCVPPTGTTDPGVCEFIPRLGRCFHHCDTAGDHPFENDVPPVRGGCTVSHPLLGPQHRPCRDGMHAAACPLSGQCMPPAQRCEQDAQRPAGVPPPTMNIRNRDQKTAGSYAFLGSNLA